MPKIEGKKHLPAAYSLSDAASGVGVFHCCESTTLTCGWLDVHQGLGSFPAKLLSAATWLLTSAQGFQAPCSLLVLRMLLEQGETLPRSW